MLPLGFPRKSVPGPHAELGTGAHSCQVLGDDRASPFPPGLSSVMLGGLEVGRFIQFSH